MYTMQYIGHFGMPVFTSGCLGELLWEEGLWQVAGSVSFLQSVCIEPKCHMTSMSILVVVFIKWLIAREGCFVK